jgi:hypothetical protein
MIDALKEWWQRLIARGQPPQTPPPLDKPKLDPYGKLPPDVEKRRVPHKDDTD